MAADWDPEQYARFAAERAQPFWDLVGLLDASAPIERLVDLGCGSGELTAELVERLEPAEAIGVDSSPAMLEKAVVHTTTNLRFETGDIAEWTSADGVDVVVANASLQWVPDHRAVLRRWTAALRPGGQLAVQVPANDDHPSHLVSAGVARTSPFAEALDHGPPDDPVAANVRTPQWYSSTLYALGFVEQHVRLQVYALVLPSSADVVEWVKGTSLTRFFRRLPPELHEPFVEAYRARLLDEIGEQQPYLYPFKRILFWGRLDRGRPLRGGGGAGRPPTHPGPSAPIR